MSGGTKNKKRDLTALGLAVVIIVLLNFVGSFVFHRFDLTSEKRYTLSDATKKLLSEINDVVYVKVYLDGEFPAGFKRLRNETKEMLDEFRAYSNDNIEYEFIDPSVSDNKKQQNEIYKQLYDKGLEPTNLEVKEESGTTQQIIWPAALVTYKGRELPWQLLKTQMGQSSEGQLNNSIQALEYEFASVVRNLSTVFRPQIGFIEGHGELDTLETYDIAAALSDFYVVKRVEIKQQLKALDGFKAIVIAKPDTAFSDQDKFIIDQFIMKGGKVLWVFDPLYTPVDSLSRRGNTVAIPYELGIDKMLYKYGVRVNDKMLLDVQCSAIPINKALKGQQPRFELMPWIFSPLLNPLNDHPIVKNLDIIKTDFASTIDTIEVKGIKKTILLQSSKYSKTLVQPVRVDLNYLRYPIDEKQFNDPYQNVAVLLEGEFESVFKNRLPPEIANDSAIGFKPNGKKSAMIVIADGDVIRNDVQYSTRKPYPLGFDKYTNRTYGNRNFILNCVNYLCDDSGLLSVRARELTLRLLDKKKVKNEGTKWKVINTAVPLLLVLVFGLIYYYVRKRKYSS
jgi:ABC-2 type transport system permease protein